MKERVGIHIQAGGERTQDAISDAASLTQRGREGVGGGGEQVEMTLKYVTVEGDGGGE